MQWKSATLPDAVNPLYRADGVCHWMQNGEVLPISGKASRDKDESEHLLSTWNEWVSAGLRTLKTR